ncbi:hypothetical protein ACNPNP_10835, partial [Microbacterium sp. AGC85]
IRTKPQMLPSDPTTISFGANTYADVPLDPSGEPTPHAQVIRDVIAEARLADDVGIDSLGIGEHNRSHSERPLPSESTTALLI